MFFFFECYFWPFFSLCFVLFCFVLFSLTSAANDEHHFIIHLI